MEMRDASFSKPLPNQCSYKFDSWKSYQWDAKSTYIGHWHSNMVSKNANAACGRKRMASPTTKPMPLYASVLL